MAGGKIGGESEEFERLLILAEEDTAQTPKAKEALKDWRTKFTDYGAAMFFSPKQWSWLKSLAGEAEDDDRVERRTVPRTDPNDTGLADIEPRPKKKKDRGNPDSDDDIPF